MIIQKGCDAVVDRIIKEINTCLENKCYISALGMALTLPDICGRAKYPQWEKHDVGLRYKKWYDEYIGFREIPSGPHSEKMPYLNGDVVYSLRNCQGQPGVESEKIREERCKVDKFILVINDGITSSGVSLNEDGSISSRELEVDVRSLCGKLTRAAERYYHENAERFDFINFKIMGL